MKSIRLAAILSGVLAVAACGGGKSEPADSVDGADAGSETAAPAPVAPSEAESETAQPVAAADPGARPQDFAQCAICHSTEAGKNGIGPSLAGAFGAKAAHIGDFAYSTKMRESGLVWDEQTLNRFLENPQTVVPGTKMSFAGVRDAEKRAAIIAYLKTL